jgi:hypothetical protein
LNKPKQLTQAARAPELSSANRSGPKYTGFPVAEYGIALIVAAETNIYNSITAHKPTRSEAGAEYSNIWRLPFLLGAIFVPPSHPNVTAVT